jgi:mono/diheme cytochrome c family protein
MADTKKHVRLINGRFPKPPFWMTSLALIGFCLSLLLFAAVLRSRGAYSHEPRVHLVQDMDNQVKFKTQHTSDVFADGRASRPKVLGTVAFGHLDADDHLYRGFSASWNAGAGKWDSKFFDGIPVKVDEALLQRGQIKFNTYCMPCHGYDGRGNGPVAFRSNELQQNGVAGMSWVTPSNLTDATIVARQDGHIFNTLTNGIRNMAGYGSAIPDPTDRWAIVSYVRALQLSATGVKAPATGPQASAK